MRTHALTIGYAADQKQLGMEGLIASPGDDAAINIHDHLDLRFEGELTDNSEASWEHQHKPIIRAGVSDTTIHREPN